jgi:hypothetical protein
LRNKVGDNQVIGARKELEGPQCIANPYESNRRARAAEEADEPKTWT